METLKESQKHRTAKSILAAIVGLVVIVFIIALCTNKGNDSGKESSVGKNEAYIVSQKFVKPRLISPSTAAFPFSYDFCTEYKDSTFLVKGHVDSQNVFGAEIRTSYEITLKYNGGQWNDPRNWTELGFNAY